MKTVVFFFTKGAPTRKTWFYQLDPGRNMGKTKPLNADTHDLSVKNPNTPETAPLRTPEEILNEIEALDQETHQVLTKIRALL